jgi:hypothetical protein
MKRPYQMGGAVGWLAGALIAGWVGQAFAQAPSDASSRCEAEVRRRADVETIVSRSKSRLGEKILFRGRSGWDIEATCGGGPGSAAVTFVTHEPMALGDWGARGRPPGLPQGAALCDPDAAVESYLKQIYGDDRSRLTSARETRQGAVLSLRLEGGREARFRDRPCDDDQADCAVYRFLNYDPAHRAYLVAARYYEGQNLILVDARTGGQIGLKGYPFWSPDGKWVAAASVFDFIDGPSVFEIWDWRAGKAEPAYSLDGSAGWTCVRGWTGRRGLDLAFIKDGEKIGQPRRLVERKAELGDAGWRLTPPGSGR